MKLQRDRMERYKRKRVEQYALIDKKQNNEAKSTTRKITTHKTVKPMTNNNAITMMYDNTYITPGTKNKVTNKQKNSKIKENDGGVSICLSAWNTQDYIEECLDSIANQTWFKTHDNWEILLGIDACEKTLAKVKEIIHKYKNLSVYMMNENVGTYVTCNTIMKLAKYEWLQRFDTDDIMMPNMIETMMKEKGDAKFITPHCIDFPDQPLTLHWGEGQMMVSKTEFDKYGGFMNWKCGADTELRVRLRGKIKEIDIKKELFKRRKRNDSLTQEKSTSYDSEYRANIKKYIRENSSKNPIIKCHTTQYTEIYIPPQLIVSFTTWKKRHETAAKMLEYFKNQIVKPDKIYCWLSREEYGGENIPQCLQKYIDEKYIEVKWVDRNTYGYKRYEVFKDHFRDYVFLIDDDIYYDTDYLQIMYNTAKKHKTNVICYLGNYIEFTNERELMSLKENPSVKNTILSGLSCYPPNIFPMEYFKCLDIRDKISPKCDDSFMRLLAIKNDISVFCVYDRKKKTFKTIPDSQSVGIWNTENKSQINGLNKQTDIFKKLIREFKLENKCREIWKKIVL